MTNTTESSNLEATRRGYEAFSKGDVETLRQLFAANARYRHTPLGEFLGDYYGWDAILDFFTRISRASDGTYNAAPMAMAAGGDTVFVSYRSTGWRGGKSLETEQVAVFTFNAGIIIDAVLFFRDWSSDAAFWS